MSDHLNDAEAFFKGGEVAGLSDRLIEAGHNELRRLGATVNDPVNHPNHYQANGMEAWDVIDAFFHDKYHLGAAFKYLARAGKKDNETRDLRKAIAEIERHIHTRRQNNHDDC